MTMETCCDCIFTACSAAVRMMYGACELHVSDNPLRPFHRNILTDVIVKDASHERQGIARLDRYTTSWS